MSVFDKDDGTPAAPDTSNITLETLVGEGQKYKDPNELAKAYVNADAHIETLKREAMEREAELKVLKDIYEKTNKSSVDGVKTPPVDDSRQKDQPEKNLPIDTSSNVDSNKGLNKEQDLSELVRLELEKQDSEKLFTSNIKEVSDKLAEHFGGEIEAKRAVAEKAKELQVGKEWLMEIAGKSPTAFYNTFGLNASSMSSPNSAYSSVNMRARDDSKSTRNFKYYETVRKENPKLYYSVQFRKQMFDDATKMGGEFYT